MLKMTEYYLSKYVVMLYFVKCSTILLYKLALFYKKGTIFFVINAGRLRKVT
jgi:hypothetical protein